MQVLYNSAGQPYLVGASGNTVGPAPNPKPSLLSQQAASRVKAKTSPAAHDPFATQSKPEVPSSPSPEAADDPLGKFLDYDFGGGVKMKFALPAFILVLAALKKRRR